MRASVFVLALLLVPMSTAFGARRVESWFLLGGGRLTSADHRGLTTWPMATVGTGCQVSRRLVVEMSAAYRPMGVVHHDVRTAAIDENSTHDAFQMMSVMAGPTILLPGPAPVRTFVSSTMGLYVIRGSFSPGRESAWSTRPGLSVGVGVMGPAGSHVPRFDVRLQARAPETRGSVWPDGSRHWLQTAEAGVGTQF